jgi:hypothetical protein
MKNDIIHGWIQEELMRIKEKQEILKRYPYYENLLFNLSPEQEIFRLEKLEHLENNLENNRLYFCNPVVWHEDDPYDSIIIMTPFETFDGLAFQDYRDEYFGQCWSANQQDVMWRLYPKDEKRVMIISKVNKIMDRIWNESNAFMRSWIWAGKIIYISLLELQDENLLVKYNYFPYDSSAKGIAQLLLLKHDFFKHEKEVRFIVWDKNSKGKEGTFVKIREGYHLKDCIDKVLIDPRADDSFFEETKNKLNKYNFNVERTDIMSRFPTKYILPQIC